MFNLLNKKKIVSTYSNIINLYLNNIKINLK